MTDQEGQGLEERTKRLEEEKRMIVRKISSKLSSGKAEGKSWRERLKEIKEETRRLKEIEIESHEAEIQAQLEEIFEDLAEHDLLSG